jgi:hypothetical protein
MKCWRLERTIDRIALAHKRESILRPLAKENEKARKGKQAGSSSANLPNLPIDTRKECAKAVGKASHPTGNGSRTIGTRKREKKR